LIGRRYISLNTFHSEHLRSYSKCGRLC